MNGGMRSRFPLYPYRVRDTTTHHQRPERHRQAVFFRCRDRTIAFVRAAPGSSLSCRCAVSRMQCPRCRNLPGLVPLGVARTVPLSQGAGAKSGTRRPLRGRGLTDRSSDAESQRLAIRHRSFPRGDVFPGRWRLLRSFAPGGIGSVLARKNGKRGSISVSSPALRDRPAPRPRQPASVFAPGDL